MSAFIPLDRDPKWNVFGDYTWESFQEKYLPKVDLIPTVHPEVQKRYRAIRMLMAHSYYEYEFFDIAAAQMTMLVEMAMVWKYEQVTGEAWNKKTKKGEKKRDLKNLFDWLNQNRLFASNFPTDNTLLRQVRNYYAHPKEHGFGGGINLKSIIHLIHFINELYDPHLKTANDLSAPIASWINSNARLRKVMRVTEGQFPLSTIYLAFIDCSTLEPHYYFALFPLFDLQKIDRQRPSTMAVIQMVNPKIQGTSLCGTDVTTGKEISIELAEPSISKLIDKWHKNLYEDKELDPLIPMWRMIEMQQLVEDLKNTYYKKM